MELIIVDMDDSSRGELFHRSLLEILSAVSRGQLVFFPTKTLQEPFPRVTENYFYPPEMHTTIEMACCLKHRVKLYINGEHRILKPGSLNVILPGDVHAERFSRVNTGYQMFWIQISPEYLGYQISCYEPKKGYYLLGKHMELKLESREVLLSLGGNHQLHTDHVLQIQFQSRLMEMMLESLPLIRQTPDHGVTHIPYSAYLIEQVKHHLDSHYRQPLSLPELGKIFHYSPSHLNMLFRKQYHLPILKYILLKRIDLAEKMLQTTSLEIKQVAYQTGFNDPLYFSRMFRKIKGRSPSEYRK